MAAPERFAESQICSCTAGTVHTWPGAAFVAAPTWSRLGVKQTPLEVARMTRLTHFDTSRLQIIALQNSCTSTIQLGNCRRTFPSVRQKFDAEFKFVAT